MGKLALHWKIIIGLILGIVWAFLSTQLGLSKFTMNWINPFGTIFINLLKLIAMPLVLFSIMKGISDLSDTTKLGRLGLKTLVLYLMSTVLAVAIGLLLVNLWQPGKSASEEQRIVNRIAYEMWVAETKDVEVLDGKHLLRDAAYAKYHDSAQEKLSEAAEAEDVQTKVASVKEKESGPLDFVVDMVPSNIFTSLSNNKMMLQIIFFALFFGITLISIPRKKAQPVIDFIDGVNDVFLKMVEIVMAMAPFFVFALLAGTMVKMAGDDPNKMIEIFKGLASYSLAVLVGLFLMVFVAYPTIYYFLARRFKHKSMPASYGYFFGAMGPAQLLAFSTSSSAATLPVTMECVRDRVGVSREVSSFVLPIGATVNMDGTSMYQAIAVVFLAQFHMVDLTIAQQLTIVLTATLASIGSAAVPSAGLIMMIIVLQSVGLNPAWIAIILPVDRILDMCRTVVNVTGDATVASIVAESEGELIEPKNWDDYELEELTDIEDR